MTMWRFALLIRAQEFAEECERLFTPYYTTKQHGTGLGLAIVQSVIADHAGNFAVEADRAAALYL